MMTTQWNEEQMTKEDKRMLWAVLIGYWIFYAILAFVIAYNLIAIKRWEGNTAVFASLAITGATALLAWLLHRKILRDLTANLVLAGTAKLTDRGYNISSRSRYVTFDCTGDEKFRPLAGTRKFVVGDAVKIRISPTSRVLLKMEYADAKGNTITN